MKETKRKTLKKSRKKKKDLRWRKESFFFKWTNWIKGKKNNNDYGESKISNKKEISKEPRKVLGKMWK